MKEDAGGTFKRLALSGFKSVEMAGLFGHEPQAIRRMLDDAGLECRSMHVEASDDALTLSGDIDRVASAAHVIGAQMIVMPIFLYPDGFLPPAGPNPMEMVRAAGRAMRKRDYERNAAFLNKTGKALHGLGLSLAYHNHNVELAPIDGTSGLDVLVAQTDARYVAFELDIGWVAAAGLDPISILHRYKGRIAALHLKDTQRSTRPNFDLHFDDARIGQGRIDWRPVLAACNATDIPRAYVEVEGLKAGDGVTPLADDLQTLIQLQSS